MGKNSITKLSKIISDEVTIESTITEINFAIKEVEKILLIEKSRRENTLIEISQIKIENYMEVSTLNNYLENIENNIFNLNNYVDVLNSKKRLLEYETKRAFPQ